jgi:hypothetical protein
LVTGFSFQLTIELRPLFTDLLQSWDGKSVTGSRLLGQNASFWRLFTAIWSLSPNFFPQASKHHAHAELDDSARVRA